MIIGPILCDGSEVGFIDVEFGVGAAAYPGASGGGVGASLPSDPLAPGHEELGHGYAPTHHAHGPGRHGSKQSAPTKHHTPGMQHFHHPSSHEEGKVGAASPKPKARPHETPHELHKKVVTAAAEDPNKAKKISPDEATARDPSKASSEVSDTIKDPGKAAQVSDEAKKAAADPGVAKPADKTKYGEGDSPALGTPAQPKEDLRGSAYLKNQRQWIADELNADPSLRRLTRGVITHEQDPGYRKMVFESLTNRLNFLREHGQPNLTLREYLSRTGDNQFYGPIRRGEINEDYLRRAVDPYAADVDKEMNEVLAGSNYVKGYTDQGGPGDPNYDKSVLFYNKEGYGNFGNAEIWRRQQQARVAGEGGATAATGGDQGGVSRPYERRMGVPGEFNWAATGALGSPGTNLKTITLDNGKTVVVNSAVADRYQGFLNELLARGYPINDVGGYNYRPKRGNSGLSMHSYGAAVDVNPDRNAFHGRTTDMPADVEQMAWRHGLSWGGRFGDPMHFEPMSDEAWESKKRQMDSQ